METTRIQKNNRTKLEEVIPLETPYVIGVDVSSACNFRCKFCYQSDQTKLKNISGYPKLMSFDDFRIIINDLHDFPDKIKTFRMYGFGESTLNKYFPEFVSMAKKSNKIEKVDTTTNGSQLTPEFSKKIIDAGIDRINISVEGVNNNQYKDFAGVNFDFNKFVSNLEYLYKNKKQCEIFIKINGDILTDAEKIYFKETFEPISDGIGIESVSDCWNDFKPDNVNKEKGLYGQELEEVDVCSYPFYSYQVHADGKVSVCFLDWNKKLLVGDIFSETLYQIWNGQRFNDFRKFMLQNNRKHHSVCGKCGQLKYGMPDNIDKYADMLLKRF